MLGRKINLKKLFLWFLVSGVILFVSFFVVTSLIIDRGVEEKCDLAWQKYADEDCVGALISTLKDKENSYRERNDAIWALGQLRDERALPSLESFYTGDIPDREPYDGVISQYELKKAIKLLSKN